MDVPSFLTADQAAELLQVDRETIYRAIRAGEIKAVHLRRAIRIPRSEIERLERGE